MREFLKGLDLDKETIDTIMAEYGKNITGKTEKIQELESKVKEYEATINDLSSKAENNQKVSEELETLKQQIADNEAKAKAEEQDKILTNNIMKVIGDKQFVNDYTKDSIINEIKKELNDNNNAGKSAKDIFEAITKDRTDIFDNPNKISDIPGASQNNIGDQTINNASTGVKLNPIFRKF